MVELFLLADNKRVLDYDNIVHKQFIVIFILNVFNTNIYLNIYLELVVSRSVGKSWFSFVNIYSYIRIYTYIVISIILYL